jgi:hypothetical protein
MSRLRVSNADSTAGATAHAASRVGVCVAHAAPAIATTTTTGTRKKTVSLRRRLNA